jgi:hypothetical protein
MCLSDDEVANDLSLSEGDVSCQSDLEVSLLIAVQVTFQDG